MSSLKISGKIVLSNEVIIAGNKNAALPCLAATLLLPMNQPQHSLTISNLPHIRDVLVLINLLTSWGITVQFVGHRQVKITNTSFRTDPEGEISIPPEEAKKFRGSVLLLGPLLNKFKRVIVPQVGGCKIGPRPIDSHLQAFEALGVDISGINDGAYVLTRNPHKEINRIGKEIWLKEASVTATENILLFIAQNRVGHCLKITNAACEPHIETLGDLLLAFGLAAEGLGTNTLLLTPSSTDFGPPIPAEVSLEPDYIEATTYAVAAALTGSDISITNINPSHLTLINWYLNQMGVYTRFTGHSSGQTCWKIYGRNSHLEINPSLKDIKAEPWHGLPTDVLPLFIVLATQCKGSIEFVDYMYDGRLTNLTAALQRMGAAIESLGNRSLIVCGPSPLIAQNHSSPDLRSGVGLVLAGLAAQGETVIDQFEIVERGYDNLPEKLLRLGAKVEKLEPLPIPS
ncbi:MAG: UDP-N-acetylglucosamine 1-carboxyvinyltransferase [bacterium]|nr:UDP-N-acetylglucosamine 1-carboxyvinyltransferase [bacterium]